MNVGRNTVVEGTGYLPTTQYVRRLQVTLFNLKVTVFLKVI